MYKHVPTRLTPISLATISVAGAVMLLLLAFAVARATSGDEVLGKVEVAGVPIGGLDEDQAITAILGAEESIIGRTGVFTVDGTTVQLSPQSVGLDLDEEAMVRTAMSVGREGNLIEQFLWWLTHLFKTTRLQLDGTLDPDLLAETFDNWDVEVINNPALQGGISLVDGQLVAEYPAPGLGIDRVAAAGVVTEALLSDTPTLATIPVASLTPELTDDDVDAAMEVATRMLSGPMFLEHERASTRLTVDQLKQAFKSETMTNSPVEIVLSFDPEAVDELLSTVRGDIEDEPVNARFEIAGDLVNVIPGRKGTKIDAADTARLMFDAARNGSRTVELPIVEGADPERTTEYLESLNVKHLVSRFTTYYSCCEPRVTNIKQIAKDTHLSLVLPGQTWSLNEHVGQRTVEKGYVEAGGILGGELVDQLGGGTSQFTTTLYNALFWGGYEDVEHKPHSWYFSRYPEGIEATLSWRSPDLKFRNNRNHAVLIYTNATDTSITVRIYGYNDGRTVAGEQSGGQTRTWVPSAGGPDALHVKATVSERYALTDPPPPLIRANPEVKVDQPKTVQTAAGGFSVTVTRIVTDAAGKVLEERRWVVRYVPKQEIIEVHPCQMPGSTQTCPTTTTPPTTTTVPEETTTTAPNGDPPGDD